MKQRFKLFDKFSLPDNQQSNVWNNIKNQKNNFKEPKQ